MEDTKELIKQHIELECDTSCISQDQALKNYLMVCLELYNEDSPQWYESFSNRK